MAETLGDDQWRQILDLAHEAADLPPEQRRSFLESRCSDPEIITRALELAEEADLPGEMPSISVGSQLGSFTITGKIGHGGMGQVFAARDSELERTVALKILLPGAANTGSSRILREARTASALNHPNIVTIHEVLKFGASIGIVMEFVPGVSLRTWIGTSHTLREALPVMQQMTSAVEAAHAAQIIHRDLKPENVIVRPDGQVKILDFGLARSAGIGNSTQSGSFGNFAGTFRYLPPELWRGTSPTSASDIFSLGLVFYEVLTGKYPFEATSPMHLMESVTESAPPRSSTLNPAVCPALDELIGKMLAKDPVARPTAPAVQDVLRSLDSTQQGVVPGTWKSPMPWMAAGTVLVLISALALWTSGAWNFTGKRSRLADNFKLLPLANETGFNSSPTFSPNGQQIAYSWNGPKQDNVDIYVKAASAQEPRRLTTSLEVDYSPAWSPDGKTIAFCRGTETGNAAIWVMSSEGGAEKKLFDLHWRADYQNRHLSWSPDGKHLAFPDQLSDGAETNALFELDIAAGESRQLTFPNGPQIDHQPAYSPDGQFLAFVRDHGGGVNNIYLLPLADQSGNPQLLQWKGLDGVNTSRPIWTPDSKELLFLVGLSGDYHMWSAPARQGAEARALAPIGSNPYDATISSTGRLAVVYQHYDTDIYKLDLERARKGLPTAPEQIANSKRLEQNPKVSRDGRRIAFESNRTGSMEIWIANVDGTNASPLTDLQHEVTGSPAWSYDGRRIAFDSRSDGAPRLHVMDSQGGTPQVITSEEDKSVVPAWSPDGAWIYFSSDRLGNSELWRMPSRGGHKDQLTHHGGFAPVASPDGTRLYYAADRTRITKLGMLDLATATETAVADQVLRRNYAAGQQGVYFISGLLLGPRDLKFADQNGKITQIYRFEKALSDGIDVSPDERTLYFSQLDQNGAEIMLAENFWQ